MNYPKIFFAILLSAFVGSACNKPNSNNQTFNSENMMIRIAELEIDPTYLDEYLAILKEESAASVRLEPGVISIYPMYQKDTPTQIRILEIYADKAAYESHLKTPHFLKYKTTTLEMIKSLRLVDMGAIDEETLPELFYKLKD
jgi:quinol monooxygenase YgiN